MNPDHLLGCLLMLLSAIVMFVGILAAFGFLAAVLDGRGWLFV